MFFGEFICNLTQVILIVEYSRRKKNNFLYGFNKYSLLKPFGGGG